MSNPTDTGADASSRTATEPQDHVVLRRLGTDLDPPTEPGLAAPTSSRMPATPSESLLNQSQRLARLGSWEWDLAAGEFIWSEGMFPLYGLPPGSPAPTPSGFLDIVHPEDREAYRAVVQHALATGGVHSFEHRVITPVGAIRHIVGWAEVQNGPDGTPARVIGSAQDQTVRVERDRAVAHSEQLHRLIVDSSPIGMGLMNLEGWWVQANTALCTLIGRAPGDLIGHHFTETIHPDDDVSKDRGLLNDLLEGRRSSYRVDRRVVHPDGRMVWTETHISLLQPVDDGPPQMLAQILDVTERQRVTDEFARQANADPLTGVANRRVWQRELDRHLALCADTGTELPIAVLEIDHFQVFNETYGHVDGDQLLLDTAMDWAEHLDEHARIAVLARIGGAQFGLLLPGFNGPDAYDAVAALVARVPRRQTVSAGLTLSLPSDDYRTLMSRTDVALYLAKQKGRGQIEVHLPPVPPTPSGRRAVPSRFQVRRRH